MDNRLNIVFDAFCLRGDQESVESLAKKMGVSTRTVYNDVERLNSLLDSHGEPTIRNDHGLLSYPDQLRRTFASLVDSRELIYLDPEFRKRVIARQVLLQPDFFSAESLQELVDIPRNTLVRDLGTIRERFRGYGIALESEPFRGYVVRGSEYAIRTLLSRLVEGDKSFIENRLSGTEKAQASEMTRLTIDISDALQVSFSDAANNRLLANLYSASCRVRLGKEIVQPPLDVVETRERQVVRDFARRIARVYRVSALPEGELWFVANRLRECSVVRYDELISENWVKINLLVRRMIKEVSSFFPNARFEEDDVLFRGIVNHIRPAYWRAYNREQDTNPLLSYVRKQCRDLHEAVCSSVANAVQQELGIAFDENELAYLTLFFAASLERRNCVAHRVPRVVVVCPEGISTSHLLSARLGSSFNLNVVGVFSVREAASWLEQNSVDCVISTVPIDTACPSFVVSPQLTDDDRTRLSAVLGARKAEVDVSEMVRLIRRHVSIDEKSSRSIARELELYLGIRSAKDYTEERYEPMLKELLAEDAIELGFHATDRDTVVREAGALLVKKGVATQEYVDAMIENVEVNGTYIVIAPGIAMPHARPESGARGIGFSLLTLDHPIEFGHPKNDPVQLVVALCAIDHQTHLSALAELAEMLSDPQNVKAILEATDPKEVTRLIEGSN